MVESVSGGVLSFFKDEHVPGWQTMIRIEFSEDEIEQLRRERFEHPHPLVQRKMEALLLKSEGLPHSQITRILGVSENTLRQYLREYRDEGIERLKEIRFRHPRSELDEHRKSSTSWTRRISCWRRFWAICGRAGVVSFEHIRAGNVSTFWERSMP